MPEASTHDQQTETLPNSRIVEINPKLLPIKEWVNIKPKYKLNSTLVQAFASISGNTDFQHDMIQSSGYIRNPVLENEDFIDGTRPRNLADFNFREMARATSQKWYVALNRMFRGLGNQEPIEYPIHSNDGRMKIAIPGGYLGFEVGGIIRFFNEQNIPVDINVIDINKTGQETESMNLDELLDVYGSTINFHPKTDVRDFLKDKKYDLAILRHPGPV